MNEGGHPAIPDTSCDEGGLVGSFRGRWKISGTGVGCGISRRIGAPSGFATLNQCPTHHGLDDLY